jgi:hypothetical protein
MSLTKSSGKLPTQASSGRKTAFFYAEASSIEAGRNPHL